MTTTTTQLAITEMYPNIRRVIDNNQEIWFVAKDVAEYLEYSDTRRTILNNVRDRYKCEYRSISNACIKQHAPNPISYQTIMINEAGLYGLVLRSNKPEAIKFQDWVTDDLIPTIRKTGKYEIGQPQICDKTWELQMQQEKTKQLQIQLNYDTRMRDQQLQIANMFKDSSNIKIKAASQDCMLHLMNPRGKKEESSVPFSVVELANHVGIMVPSNMAGKLGKYIKAKYKHHYGKVPDPNLKEPRMFTNSNGRTQNWDTQLYPKESHEIIKNWIKDFM